MTQQAVAVPGSVQAVEDPSNAARPGGATRQEVGESPFTADHGGVSGLAGARGGSLEMQLLLWPETKSGGPLDSDS